MSDLVELQQRVEQAGQRFGTLGSQHAKFSARLIELVDQLERQTSERRKEIETYVNEIARIRQERDQVKTMLHDLLHAIEAGSHAVLNDTLHELDRRASAILGETPAPSASTGMVVPFTGRFEDVSAADLAAEAVAEEQAAVAPDETVAVDAEFVAPVVAETGYGPKLPGAQPADAAAPLGESPVAEIIERIGLLTRALVETRAPNAAGQTEDGGEMVRRIA
jgi:hypothetical protein